MPETAGSRKRRPTQPRPPRDGAEWLTPAEAAHFLGLAAHTLARKRVDGSGPPYFLPSARMVRYRRADLEVWLGARRRSTSDSLPPAA